MDLVDIPAKSREATILELRDFSRRLVRELGFMRATLADSDLAPSAVHAIIEIGAQPGISAKDLGNILRLDKSNTSRQVARLEAGGLVERKTASEDARSSELYLTEAGQKLRKKIDRFATDQVSSALRRMVPADQQALVRSLALYADALTQDNAVKTVPADAVAARILEATNPAALVTWQACTPGFTRNIGASARSSKRRWRQSLPSLSASCQPMTRRCGSTPKTAGRSPRSQSTGMMNRALPICAGSLWMTHCVVPVSDGN